MQQIEGVWDKVHESDTTILAVPVFIQEVAKFIEENFDPKINRCRCGSPNFDPTGLENTKASNQQQLIRVMCKDCGVIREVNLVFFTK